MKKRETAFDVLARINELEEENYKLKRQNKILRYEALPTLEKRGAERAWAVINGSDVLNKSFDDFKCDYVDRMEIDAKSLEDLLPFD